MSVWGLMAEKFKGIFKQTKVIQEPVLAGLERHETYERYNQEAAYQGPRPIRYNAGLQHRKHKSQKRKWKHWRRKK